MGAPKGNTNATDGKRVVAALNAALKRVEKRLTITADMRDALNSECKYDGQQTLIAIWEALIVKALEEADEKAADRIFDRLAGKPVQAMALGNTTDEDGVPTVLRMVVVRPGDPKGE